MAHLAADLRRVPGRRHHWVAAALGAWLVAVACRSIQPTSVSSPEVLPSPSLDGLVEPPSVRVGILPEVAQVAIGAEGGVRVLARTDGADALRGLVNDVVPVDQMLGWPNWEKWTRTTI